MYKDQKEIADLYSDLGAQVIALLEAHKVLMDIVAALIGKNKAEERLKRELQKRGIHAD